jgi:polyhydroxyalkanoate synthesis regulator protein
VEEQVRTNMGFFMESMRMFTPFAARGETKGEKPEKAESKPVDKPEAGIDLDSLKQQMAEMQAKLEALSRK